MEVGLEMSDAVVLKPIRAVIFHVSDRGDSVAMDHAVGMDPVTQQATIREGSPMCRSAIARMVDELSEGAGYQRTKVLPECLLALSRNCMAWWRPSRRKPILFDTKTAIDEISGRYVTHPSLLFVAHPPSNERSRLFVYALTELSGRPTGDTPLYRAPYFNVYDSGFMCEGSVLLPQSARVDDIDAWERVWWDTSFAHTNAKDRELTNYPGGHDALWRAMVTEPVFPDAALVPAISRETKQQITLDEAINLP